MKPIEAAKLLGGYATGTLSEAERRTLFAAALELEPEELPAALAHARDPAHELRQQFLALQDRGGIRRV